MELVEQIQKKEEKITDLQNQIWALKAKETKQLCWHEVYHAIYNTLIIERGYQCRSHDPAYMADMISWRDEEKDHILMMTGIKQKLFPELIPDPM